MATIKQIVLKAVELKDEAEKLEGMKNDQATAQARLDSATAQVSVQQPIVTALIAQLKAML